MPESGGYIVTVSKRRFCTRIAVRSYELDSLGHVNQAVYHQYAELARAEALAAAGCRIDELVTLGISPILLESRINFRRELRGTDVIEISCQATFGASNTFEIQHVITKADGRVSAVLTCRAGLLDLKARKLVDNPRAVLESVGADLSLLLDEADSAEMSV